MGELEDSVLGLLRSSEELRAVLETQLVSLVNPTLASPASRSRSAENYSSEDTRILAVVTHQDDWSVSEEGSVFVCKFNHVGHKLPKKLDILRVLPITDDFSITMTQMRRGTIDLSTETSRAALDQPSGFSLTISPGLGARPGSDPLSLFTHDVQNLRVVLNESKRIKKLSGDLINIIHIGINPIPQDLRSLNLPLHARLSTASAGLPGDDFADIDAIRDEWIRSRTRKVVQRGRRRISIRIGTFNVNGKLPSQDLASWIRGPSWASTTRLASTQSLASTLAMGNDENDEPETEVLDSDPYPDMLVLGFQELDLSTEALLYSTSTVREDAWCLAVFASLGEKAIMYDKLASKQLVGMLIMIVVKKALRSCFSDIYTSAIGSGIMGVFGNKGGTAIRMTFTPPLLSSGDPNSTTFTFVNSHLAAFDEQYDKRNSDFQDLSKRLKFESEILDATTLPITLYESDILFWMVYLNYRLDIPDDDVRNILNSNQRDEGLQMLLRYDQLNKAMGAGKAFEGFIECSIGYPPTYRFGDWPSDGLSYDRKRKPAWTDRVLYMSAPSVGVRPVSYTSHPQITMSDHRPVSADFAVDIDCYEKRSYDATAQRLYWEVDYLEEYSERNNISLDNTTVNFSEISYKDPTSQTIQIQNNGKVPCAFRFIPADNSSDIHPDWLRIEPMTDLLLPGEVMSITLTAYVDTNSASKLNVGPKNLSWTLILRIIMGKDYFISITGEYQYTCFGNKLSNLIRLRGPVRPLELATPDDLHPASRPINAPREIMRLINWMMSGSHNCLDTGEEFPFSPSDNEPHIALAFSMTLLQLLNTLTEPVVPASLHQRCIQMTSRDEAFELLDAFPPPSVNVWISLTAFLHFICQSSENPSDKAERIATIFAPVLLRDDPESPDPPVSPLGRRNFLLYFIS
ncbi:DNase I-like protein [Tricholoma matsutake]|nr:DNase I-like protein [Tricholoma matsutake 945]